MPYTIKITYDVYLTMSSQKPKTLDIAWKKGTYKDYVAAALNMYLDEVVIVTSLAKEVMFLVALVSLSVCLFVCGQHYSKSYERIGMKFYGGVQSSTRKN